MKSHLLQRFLLTLVALWGSTILVFALVHVAPGDPATAIAMARHHGIENLSPEEIERIREEEGLNSPIHIQYLKWLSHVVQGDFGRSLVDGTSVSEEIWRRLPATLELAIAATVISLLIAVPLGMVSASRPNSLLDHVSMTAAVIGVSIPNFWLGLLLILLFSVHLGWLPVYGRGGLDHLVLPALTLGSGMAAITSRLTRSGMIEVLSQNYIRTARAKGLPERIIFIRHALRNALIPIVTVVGLQFALLLEGTVIVETIFAWPGIGRLLVDAIHSRDFAMIHGCALFIAAAFAAVNFLVDIVYTRLDPRIRYTGGIP